MSGESPKHEPKGAAQASAQPDPPKNLDEEAKKKRKHLQRQQAQDSGSMDEQLPGVIDPTESIQGQDMAQYGGGMDEKPALLTIDPVGLHKNPPIFQENPSIDSTVQQFQGPAKVEEDQANLAEISSKLAGISSKLDEISANFIDLKQNSTFVGQGADEETSTSSLETLEGKKIIKETQV